MKCDQIWITKNRIFCSIWPGACLSTFENGGKWKLANYVVEKMFRPLVVVPEVTLEEHVKVHVINDGGTAASNLSLQIQLQKYSELKPCFQQKITILQQVAHLQSIEVLDVDLRTMLNQCSFPSGSETTTKNPEELGAAPLDSLTVNVSTKEPSPEPDYRRFYSLLSVKMFDSTSKLVSERTKLLTEPKEVIGLANPKLNVQVKVISTEIFEILISTKAVALFVALDIDIPGQFSENGFHLLEASKYVIFHSDDVTKMSAETFTQQLRVISYYNDFQLANFNS